MVIEKGTKILIEAEILRQALDTGRKEKDKGYLVKAGRSADYFYVDPSQIYFPRQTK